MESANNLVAVLVEQEEYDETQSVLIKALQLKSNYAEAHCNMALFFIGKEIYNQALTSLAKAIPLKVDYADAYFGQSRVQQELNQLESAVPSARLAIESDPKHADAHALLGGIYI